MASVRGPPKPIVPQHVVRTTPAAFPRPAYLDHSALRHLLQVEGPEPPIPSRRADASASTTSARNQAYANALSVSSDNDDTRSASSSPVPTPLPRVDQPLKLPTRWSEQDRHTGLSVSSDGRELIFNGPSCSAEKEAASARTIYPIPRACGIFYYEVEILGKDQKAHISIGFASKSGKFVRLPGWDANSWGYYGDDGCALSPERSGFQYGQPFGTGDFIGCGIDFSTYKAFYTKNGILIGPVFDNVGKNGDLFPSVGIQHTGESVRANFGQDPFKYDIDDHVQQQRNVTWNKILSTSLNRSVLHGRYRRTGVGSIASITNDTGVQQSLTEEESKQVLNQLVMTYLVHHGYAKTAHAFGRQYEGRDKDPSKDASNTSGHGPDVEMKASSSTSESVEIDIQSRTNVVNSVLAGDLDSAIGTLQKRYPTVLEADDHMLLFKLRCRKFVELFLETTEMKKRMKAIKERELAKSKAPELPLQDTWMDEEMSMDIDEEPSVPHHRRPSIAPSPMDHTEELNGKELWSPDTISAQYESALNAALAYGQTLTNDHQSDNRLEVQQLFKKTFGIVAFEDPLDPSCPVVDVASHDSRVALAHDVNQAILKSQGRPAQPALETLYRHTATAITQLGLSGVGAAAFADMSKEFLQP
ncbi:unnamed protein product [Cyclocybe aegerita]|uniref:SPRY-domain-containing protein n=1 Tax=Cyclocybe aegerita TaxID=1973307 RepID=A0A8S0VTD4_CYCAE|nr:unnamed protein product [Cyclocybe aegerita]